MQRHPRSPDFKFKETGEPLWINGFKTPSWVLDDLTAYDEKRQDRPQGTVDSQFNGLSGVH